jgi:hypothetical protein
VCVVAAQRYTTLGMVSRFEAMFEEWRVAVSHLIAEGEQIGRHLQTIAQQFESVDESF